MNVKRIAVAATLATLPVVAATAAHGQDAGTACHYSVMVDPVGPWSELNVTVTVDGDGSLSWSDGNVEPYEVARVVVISATGQTLHEYAAATPGASGLSTDGPIVRYAVCLRATTVRLPDAETIPTPAPEVGPDAPPWTGAPAPVETAAPSSEPPALEPVAVEVDELPAGVLALEELPNTGGAPFPFVVFGAVLLLAGVPLVALRRR